MSSTRAISAVSCNLTLAGPSLGAGMECSLEMEDCGGRRINRSLDRIDDGAQLWFDLDREESLPKLLASIRTVETGVQMTECCRGMVLDFLVHEQGEAFAGSR